MADVLKKSFYKRFLNNRFHFPIIDFTGKALKFKPCKPKQVFKKFYLRMNFLHTDLNYLIFCM